MEDCAPHGQLLVGALVGRVVAGSAELISTGKRFCSVCLRIRKLKVSPEQRGHSQDNADACMHVQLGLGSNALDINLGQACTCSFSFYSLRCCHPCQANDSMFDGISGSIFAAFSTLSASYFLSSVLEISRVYTTACQALSTKCNVWRVDQAKDWQQAQGLKLWDEMQIS